MHRRLVAFAVLLAAPPRLAAAQAAADSLAGIVVDSATGRAMPGVTVRVASAGRPIVTTRADAAGRFVVHDLAPGRVVVTTLRIGYRPARRTVTVPLHTTDLPFELRMAPGVTTLEAVQVSGGSPVSVDVRTGDQVFQRDDYHGSPTTSSTQIIQQSIAGAARAPTGEVHIRGQHAEYTFYIDGVPVPAGIGGSVNELFDPAITDRIGFQTGGWDAQYGNRNLAVVNVETRTPDPGLHLQLSAYGGSFDSQGQSGIATYGARGWSLLVSASRQQTAMRREPVATNADGGALNLHNNGRDDFGFLKLAVQPSEHDLLTVNVSASGTWSQTPFNPAFGALDDVQTDGNAFLNIGWRHDFESRGRGAQLFAAVYLRRSALDYEPGRTDDPQFIFYPDTTRRFNVQERRTATTTGLKVDVSVQPAEWLRVKGGIDASLVQGREAFNTVDAVGASGPSVNTSVRGGDAGAYLQAAMDLGSRWELRTGLRLDHHVAPLAGDIHQVSPRVRLTWRPNAASSVWAYYGRLFVPSNVEDFRVLATAALGETVGQATLPERDTYMEVGAARRFEPGLTTKLAAYWRDNAPGIDDNTLPGTAVVAAVNVARIRVTGIEAVLDVHPGGPFSGYVNAALNHAIGLGPVTGGFFPTPYPTGWFDLDHDQRLSIVASGTWAVERAFASLTAIHGSGLTNGNPEAGANGTGLFDFNSQLKVAPSTTFNVSVGGNARVGGNRLTIDLTADNVFDHRYILKGAFTSGPSVGRPRTITLRVTVAR